MPSNEPEPDFLPAIFIASTETKGGNTLKLTCSECDALCFSPDSSSTAAWTSLAALGTYLACAKRTEAATQQALQQLCSELGGQVPALRSAVAAAELLLTAHCHASHAVRRGWTLPQIGGERLDSTLAPYWMEPGDAVFSHVQLESGRGAIATGPNMSGKSTLMRALGACALLANCGFLCPLKPKAVVPHYSQVVWVSAEGDRPAEGISAFGYEAMISATLLRRATEGTLALVDEFGRGTEPRAAKAAVCTLIEELSGRKTQFVVATHLHDVVDVKLRTGAQPVAWRMGIRGNGSQHLGERGEGLPRIFP
eukprot:s2268_g1.t1